MESLRSINYNGQNSLNLKSKLKNLKLHPTCRGTKMGLKSLYENNKFSPPHLKPISPNLAPRNPQPAPRNPYLATRNPQPVPRNPQPATRNPYPVPRNTQPATRTFFLDRIAFFHVKSLNTRKLLRMPLLPTLKVVPRQILASVEEISPISCPKKF